MQSLLAGVVAPDEPERVKAGEEILQLVLGEVTSVRRAALAAVEPDVLHHALVPGAVRLGDELLHEPHDLGLELRRRREVVGAGEFANLGKVRRDDVLRLVDRFAEGGFRELGDAADWGQLPVEEMENDKKDDQT